MLHRLREASLRNELIARAMGALPKERPYIVDATAGLGRDSLILAALGFEITMLERSPILHTELQKALKAAKKILPDTTARLRLIHADAIDWLKALPNDQHPDIIYLDPLFPESKKSASVNKEMVMLRNLLGKEHDHADLFETAMTCAKLRVVVKRSRLASNIVERAANFSLTGKSCRFDIYLVPILKRH